MKRKQRRQRWIAVLRYHWDSPESLTTRVKTFKTYEESERYYHQFFGRFSDYRRGEMAPRMIGHIKYDDL